jgi:uncharacterized protein YjbI with pentapeptide repeats
MTAAGQLRIPKESRGMTTPSEETTQRDWAAPRLLGWSFVVAGFRTAYERDKVTGRIEAEGGKVVKEVTPALDFVVVEDPGSTASGPEKKARQLNGKQGASIRIIGPMDLYALFHVDRDQALQMWRAGEKGIARWNQLRQFKNRPVIDLRRHDFRGANLRGVQFIDVKLDDADFRNADLAEAHFHDLSGANFKGACLDAAAVSRATGCRFDGASLVGAGLSDLIGCSFRRADLSRAILSYDGRLEDCDFTEARFIRAWARRRRIASVVLVRADLREADFSECKWQEVDLRRADFSGADLHQCTLKKVDLRTVRLGHAILFRTRFDQADLTGADLRGSNLTEAVLTGTSVQKADFTGSIQTDLRFLKGDPSGAVGLDPKANRSPGVDGPAIARLAAVLKKIRYLFLDAVVDLPTGPLNLEFWTPAGKSDSFSLATWRPPQVTRETSQHSSLGDALFGGTRRWAHGTLLPESVTAKTQKCSLPADEVLALAVGAWCEAFGVEAPAPEVLAHQRRNFQADLGRERQRLLSELRGGPEGIARWNALGYEDRKRLGSFSGADMSGADLAEADLSRIDLQQANFERANLHKAALDWGHYGGARFDGANLSAAQLVNSQFEGASFARASLVGTKLWNSNLRNASFAGADLSQANLEQADLSGADLATARLEGACLKGAAFDGRTRFPARDRHLMRAMKWAGQGPNPLLAGAAGPPAQSLDLATFLKRLADHADPARLEKALAMLRADRFQLYAQAGEEALLGVVKSQSDPKLLYSCRLAAGGNFACCTQNLNVCGGLRGKLCKHLLLLLVGLARKGQLDLARVDQWVADSGLVEPALDKEVMSEALLRYKGAEAGEIDWRPTETIPEDFQTF